MKIPFQSQNDDEKWFHICFYVTETPVSQLSSGTLPLRSKSLPLSFTILGCDNYPPSSKDDVTQVLATQKVQDLFLLHQY